MQRLKTCMRSIAVNEFTRSGIDMFKDPHPQARKCHDRVLTLHDRCSDGADYGTVRGVSAAVATHAMLAGAAKRNLCGDLECLSVGDILDDYLAKCRRRVDALPKADAGTGTRNLAELIERCAAYLIDTIERSVSSDEVEACAVDVGVGVILLNEIMKLRSRR